MIVDHQKASDFLEKNSDRSAVKDILQKSRALERLSMEEVALLLNTRDQELVQQIMSTAREVKEEIYGKRLVIFAPLYVSNLCQNECLYCAFRTSNKSVVRNSLTMDQITRETEALLKTGQKRVLLVSGEVHSRENLEYIFEAIDTVYAARDGEANIRRLNVNIAPMEVEEFKELKAKEIGTYQMFQEVYHPETYKKLHVSGPKADYDYRLSAIDRAFEAGIDDVGIGILFGLYDYRYEVLSLISHIEHLEQKFGMGPHTISVPRLEPATGSQISEKPPYPVSDDDFKKIIAILRLAVPYTGLILSTRENPDTRRASFDLGISQISAGSKTSPGAYSAAEQSQDPSSAKAMDGRQFSLGDHRSLDEVIYDICEKGYIPSFCTSCYRLGRTGLDFMEYAKPGDIKQKCLPNALLTFEEYLLDYATDRTRDIGLKLIAKELAQMPAEVKENTTAMLESIRQGKRDLFV